MKVIQVLVVDDSAFMRKIITEMLESDSRLQVVGTARDGEECLQKIKKLRPDVITLDIEMPVMDGITALKKIMDDNPLPVVMLSTLTQSGTIKTFQAIAMGAIDFISKPSGAISLDLGSIKEEIISKVVVAAAANINKPIVPVQGNTTKTVSQPFNNKIVAIGTSTGGPRALEQLLMGIPIDFPAPIFIVQHMPAKFTKSLAERLNFSANITVKEAVHGEIIESGIAYIAPGDFHMKIREVGTSYAIELTSEMLMQRYQPSVDVLLQSIAALQKTNKTIAILTGMGKDGSQGIKEIKSVDKASYIIAESAESSVVHGMPKAAIETGYVDKVLHINQIGEEITHAVNKSRRD